MITVTVSYPAADGTAFDFDYYRDVHMPLVADRWSNRLKGAEALRGLPGPDGGAPAFHAIAVLRFESPDELGAAMAGAEAAEIMADIANFTSARPIVQVGETLWESKAG